MNRTSNNTGGLNQTYSENSTNNDMHLPNNNLIKQNSFGSCNDFDNNFYNQQIGAGSNSLNKEILENYRKFLVQSNIKDGRAINQMNVFNSA